MPTSCRARTLVCLSLSLFLVGFSIEVQAKTDEISCEGLKKKNPERYKVCLERKKNEPKIAAERSHYQTKRSRNWVRPSQKRVGKRVGKEERANKIATKRAKLKLLQARSKNAQQRLPIEKRSRKIRPAPAQTLAEMSWSCTPKDLSEISRCLYDPSRTSKQVHGIPNRRHRTQKKGVDIIQLAHVMSKAPDSSRALMREALAKSVRSKKEEEAAIAIRALGKLGDSASYPVVESIVRANRNLGPVVQEVGRRSDQSPKERRLIAASIALGEISGKSGTQQDQTITLLSQVAKRNRHRRGVFSAAIEGLGNIATPRTTLVLGGMISPTSSELETKTISRAASRVARNLSRADADRTEGALIAQALRNHIPTERQGLMIADSASGLGKAGIPKIIDTLENADRYRLSPKVRISLASTELRQSAANAYQNDPLSDYNERLVYVEKVAKLILQSKTARERKGLSVALSHLIPETGERPILDVLTYLADVDSKNTHYALGGGMQKFLVATLPSVIARETLEKAARIRGRGLTKGLDRFALHLNEVAHQLEISQRLEERVELAFLAGSSKAKIEIFESLAPPELEGAQEEGWLELAVFVATQEGRPQATAEKIWRKGVQNLDDELKRNLKERIESTLGNRAHDLIQSLERSGR